MKRKQTAGRNHDGVSQLVLVRCRENMQYGRQACMAQKEAICGNLLYLLSTVVWPPFEQA